MCDAIQPLCDWINEHEAEIEECEKRYDPEQCQPLITLERIVL